MSKLTPDALEWAWQFTETFDPDLYDRAELARESLNLATIVQSLLRHIEALEDG